MNVAILALGTRGDVQPYVALGAGLKEAGYEVILVTGKARWGRRYGQRTASRERSRSSVGGHPKELRTGEVPEMFLLGSRVNKALGDSRPTVTEGAGRVWHTWHVRRRQEG